MPDSLKIKPIFFTKKKNDREKINKIVLFSFFTLVSIIGSLFFVNFTQYNQFASNNEIIFHKKLFNQSEKRDNDGPLMKASTPFKSQYSLKWIDQKNGMAKVRVYLSSRNILVNQWSYNWILTPGVIAKSDLNGTFELSSLREKNYFEIDLENLKSNQSQNIIFKLKPIDKIDLAMSIVIPTIESQTLEYRERKMFKQKQQDQIGLKALKLNNNQNSENSNAHLKGIFF